MANKMTKIPARPFFVIMNLGSYWPYKSQFMALLDWYCSDKNLTHGQNRTSISINKGGKFYLVSNRAFIPADGLICMADQKLGNNFVQYFEYLETSLPQDSEFYQGILKTFKHEQR